MLVLCPTATAIAQGRPDRGWFREPPIVALAGDRPETEFNGVAAGVFLPGGGFAIADAGSSEIRMFDPVGAFRRKFGRRGDGPGEYRDLLNLVLVSDGTLLAFDGVHQRLTWLDTTGTPLRSVRVRPTPDGRRAFLIGALGDQLLLFRASDVSSMAPKATAVRFTQRLVVYDTNGSPTRTLGTVPDGEHFIQAIPQQLGGTAYWDLAFGRVTSIQAGANRFAVVDGDSYSLKVYDTNGEVVKEFSSDERRTPVRKADRFEYRRSSLARVGPNERDLEVLRVEGMPFPDSFPAYDAVAIDPQNAFWARRYLRPVDRFTVWDVYRPGRGSALQVPAPAGLRVLAIARDRVLTKRRGPDDVEIVEVWPLPAKR